MVVVDVSGLRWLMFKSWDDNQSETRRGWIYKGVVRRQLHNLTNQNKLLIKYLGYYLSLVSSLELLIID